MKQKDNTIFGVFVMLLLLIEFKIIKQRDIQQVVRCIYNITIKLYNFIVYNFNRIDLF